ncbi:MAG: hypothetical protein A2474_03055 [Elusimicrobia bacterium RIFOXYC2_FULL_34_12]|nr:MAG: hypothetical protein A2474_03055 [Elusimicrobia bacterium RIFOXYC2_FULL_34_12]OGS39106.1 MAG: hypothetical protein A2551_04150 [Elusimicrobia bacterium RIFOXYD2_FULL_34_30]HAM38760.1 hypothetical protein [Elusimicrobiota bacterium]
MSIGKSKNISFYSKLLGVTILLSFFYVWQRNTSAMLGYNITEIKERINTITEENKYLTIKIMDIKALNNLEEIAKKKLGLIAPKATDIVIIEEKN